jgi:hypothetical protein
MELRLRNRKRQGRHARAAISAGGFARGVYAIVANVDRLDTLRSRDVIGRRTQLSASQRDMQIGVFSHELASDLHI